MYGTTQEELDDCKNGETFSALIVGSHTKDGQSYYRLRNAWGWEWGLSGEQMRERMRSLPPPDVARSRPVPGGGLLSGMVSREFTDLWRARRAEPQPTFHAPGEHNTNATDAAPKGTASEVVPAAP